MLENDLWPSCLVMLITVWSLRTINIITQYNHCSLNLYFWHAAACSFNWILITCRYEHASGQHAMLWKELSKILDHQHQQSSIACNPKSAAGNTAWMNIAICPPILDTTIGGAIITQLAIFPSHKSSKKMCFECLKVVLVVVRPRC